VDRDRQGIGLDFCGRKRRPASCEEEEATRGSQNPRRRNRSGLRQSHSFIVSFHYQAKGIFNYLPLLAMVN
jgi:hypothetical protein